MLHYIIVRLWLQTYCIVQASTHPPNLTVLWFFEVLCVTTHHAKFYCSESKVSQPSSHTVLSQASAHGYSQLKRQKLRVGGYTEELKWFNYPCTRARPGCKVSCQGVPNRLALLLHPCFEASPTVEKAVLCYKADRIVASLPSFRNVQLSLAVCKFFAADEERCKRGLGRVCANIKF